MAMPQKDEEPEESWRNDNSPATVYKNIGGDGDYRGVTGSGKFATVMKSETEIDCAWEGKYTLAKAKAHAR